MSTVGAQKATPGAHPVGGNSSGNGIRGRMSSVSTYIQTNPASVRVLGGIGGVGLAVISVMSCFAIFNSFLSPLAYIQNVFFLLFGVVIAVVSILPNSALSTRIYEQAGFMSTLQGRAVFFLYLGALLFGSGLSGSSASWTYLLLGSWLLFSSAVFFVLRCRGVNDASLTQVRDDSAVSNKV